MGSRVKGAFKYVCAECKTGFYVRPYEMVRAAGLKCPACGSRFVDRSDYSASNKVMPKHEDARREAEARQRSRMGYGE
jgi:DNA-directed RNA polymerase subunit RPC12/RpoP